MTYFNSKFSENEMQMQGKNPGTLTKANMEKQETNLTFHQWKGKEQKMSFTVLNKKK